MREFLFEKDMWLLDFLSSVTFALCMTGFVQIGGDSGERHLDRILYAMLLGLLSYLATFVLAFSLRKMITSIRSWVWMGIGGAFVEILRRNIATFPSFWDYHRRFSPPEFLSIQNVLSVKLSSLLVNWIFWGLLGCLFILAVRLSVYYSRRRN